MTGLVIIGGSDAGISAALRAKELAPEVKVTVVVADAFPNYSICGLPFYLSGEIPDWHRLAHRTQEEITHEGIDLLLNHRASRIDPERHQVSVVNAQHQEQLLSYDRLILGTGAVPVRPAIEGVDLPGVFLLHTMEDSFAVNTFIEERQPRRVLIIGGGYIGLEMADALTLRGLEVTVVEHNKTVLKTVDAELGQRVGEELKQHGVQVITSVAVERIEQRETHLRVQGTQQFAQETDLVLIAVGVRPATELAEAAGIEIGDHHAIRVDRCMATNLPDIYAAGDCVETWHALLEVLMYLPLGTTSHKQGRIAGENAVGGQRRFAGSLGTQVVKIFELAVARTGLKDSEAVAAGFHPYTLETTTWDHKVYYSGAHPLHIRLTGDRETGRLLGAQLLGHWQSEVAKRVDIFATALTARMQVEDLNELDLSYTPPLSSPWDPVQMSAQAWVKARNAILKHAEAS
jgi:NADPH-dependent 2,4-dienoyl-CoA reductase/sulfur reductase-like enzyme